MVGWVKKPSRAGEKGPIRKGVRSEEQTGPLIVFRARPGRDIDLNDTAYEATRSPKRSDPVPQIVDEFGPEEPWDEQAPGETHLRIRGG